MKKWTGLLAAIAAALLASCGGGGGSPGETQAQWSIALRADRTSLPTNIALQGPGIGAFAPYTTTMYVEGSTGGRPIPDGEGVFSCDVMGGLDSGILYYLDGKDEHQDEDGNPLAFRAITLDSNAGGASFHFHALDKAGVSTIRCAVTNPRDQRTSSASVQVTVGGTTGRPASVQALAQAPGFLGSQFNLNNIRNNVGIQARVVDDANQPIPDPANANVLARILATPAAQGARILHVGDTGGGDSAVARTLNGVAQFSLSSGPQSGVIVLEFITDRADNDVTNGVADPISQLMAVAVVEGVAATPVVFASVELQAEAGLPFAAALVAEGGQPPYQWRALGPLPTGLTLSADGVVSGVPVAGTYVTRVRVTDAFGNFAEGSITFKVSGSPLTIVAATLTAQPGQPFSFALQAEGGRAPYTWKPLGVLPAGLSLSESGVISGTPTTVGTTTVAVQVTDSLGATATANISISIKVN